MERAEIIDTFETYQLPPWCLGWLRLRPLLPPLPPPCPLPLARELPPIPPKPNRPKTESRRCYEAGATDCPSSDLCDCYGCRGKVTEDVRRVGLIMGPLLRGEFEERVDIDTGLGGLPRFGPVDAVNTYSCFLTIGGSTPQ